MQVVNLTAAAASAAFFLGAAECKVAMERLSTGQALRYMRALRAQVQRSKNQFLSAAWNLNQSLTDDFDRKVGPGPFLPLLPPHSAAWNLNQSLTDDFDRKVGPGLPHLTTSLSPPPHSPLTPPPPPLTHTQSIKMHVE